MRSNTQEIEAAVEKLRAAPGRFQRLAEDVVRIVYPDRFSSISRRNRSTNDVLQPGWPDIQAVRTDGRMDAINVSMNRSWQRILEEDLSKAKHIGPGTLAGLIHVSWAPDPGVPKLEYWLSEFEALGIPRQSIDFIFRERLVSLLQEARFAAVRRGLFDFLLPADLPTLDLILFGESGWIEFKQTGRVNLNTKQRDPNMEHEVVKTIAGFMNAEGGTLLIGVADNARVFGISTDLKTLGRSRRNPDGFALWLNDLLDRTIVSIQVLADPRPVGGTVVLR